MKEDNVVSFTDAKHKKIQAEIDRLQALLEESQRRIESMRKLTENLDQEDDE